MDINTEDHALLAIEKWQDLPLAARKKKIKNAIEKLELNQMYYEQKGSDKAAQRAEKCIVLLKNHLESL